MVSTKHCSLEGCILENGSCCGSCGQNIHSNDGGGLGEWGRKETLIAWAQLKGHLVVLSMAFTEDYSGKTRAMQMINLTHFSG